MEANPDHSPPLWTADFLSVMFINLLIFLSFQMVVPVIPVYVRGPLGGSDVAVGLLSAIFTLSAVMARPFVGMLLDNVGRYSILALGMVVFALGIFGYGLAGTVLMLGVFRAVHGLGFAGTSTATTTMAADAVPRERRGEGLGYFGMSGTVMSAVAPTLGFWLADSYSFHTLFNTSVFFSLVALGIILLLRRRSQVAEHRPSAGGLRQVAERGVLPQGRDVGTVPVVDPGASGDSGGLGDLRGSRDSGSRRPRATAPGLRGLIEPKAIPASVMMLILTLTYGALSAFIALYAQELGMDNPGLFFLVYAFFILASRPVAGTLADRLGPGPIMVPSLVLGAAGMGIMWRATSSLILMVGGALYGFGFGAVVPVLLAVAITHSPDDRRGAATATYYSAFDLGIALGAAIMGPVASSWGYRSVFGAQLVIVLVGLVILLRLLPQLSAPEPTPGQVQVTGVQHDSTDEGM